MNIKPQSFEDKIEAGIEAARIAREKRELKLAQWKEEMKATIAEVKQACDDWLEINEGRHLMSAERVAYRAEQNNADRGVNGEMAKVGGQSRDYISLN